MKIILNNEYFIERTPKDLCFTLKNTYLSRGNAKNKTADPRIVTRDVAYYMTVSACVERFIHETVNDKTEDFTGTLEEYASRVNDICDHAIAEVQKGVKKIL